MYNARDVDAIMKEDVYYLSANAFVCQSQGYWIILNAASDKYLCVSQAHVNSVSHRIHRTHYSTDNSHHDLSSDGAEDVLRSLIAKDVLTPDPQCGKPFEPSRYDAPLQALTLEPSSIRTTRSPITVTKFLTASIRADCCLRFSSLSNTLRRIEQRRLRRRTANHWDSAYAARLLNTYCALRAFYPRPYLCLFDSLALIEFFASHGLFPHWIFGVIADPFCAHCWVQEGEIVINDDLDRVSRYTPVMVQ